MIRQQDPQKKTYHLKFLIRLTASLLLAWALAFTIQRWGLDLYEVSNRSMVPTLQPGDTLIIDKISFGLTVKIKNPPDPAMIRWKYPLHRRLQINDLIIFYSPIDDAPLIKRITEIGPKGITVTGDNAEYSLDSREFGPIPESQVIGKVLSVL